VPPAPEPAPVHNDAPAAPDEVRDEPEATGALLRLPEEYGLALELPWVCGGVIEPTLDRFVFEGEGTVDETALLEMCLELEAFDPATALLLFVKEEFELLLRNCKPSRQGRRYLVEVILVVFDNLNFHPNEVRNYLEPQIVGPGN